MRDFTQDRAKPLRDMRKKRPVMVTMITYNYDFWK